MSKAATLSEKERENRAKVAELNQHELRREGFECDPETKLLFQAYGELAI